MNRRLREQLIAMVQALCFCVVFGAFSYGTISLADWLTERLVPKEEILTKRMIDRDGIPDLVDSKGRIFLADLGSYGMVYRRMKASDVYRIR